MAFKSAEVLYSLQSGIADAEVANRDGKRMRKRRDALLKDVQSLIVEEGLEELVGVSEISYNGGSVFRLGGPEKRRGVSYVIGPEGVEFQQG